jgi:hypothetical protein
MARTKTPASPPTGQQPEALATLAAAARSGKGKKPATVGLEATARTAPIPGDLKQEQKAATKVLREGATGKKQGAEAAVDALPDRTRTGKK